MTNPFTSESFQEEMKPKLSMAFKALEYENIESSIQKACMELSDKLGIDTYEAICAKPEPAPEEESEEQVEDLQEQETETANEEEATDSGVKAEALDYLQRAILHFALYHHIIYLIANVSNDGVTVTKSDDKTTIYKYQQDQLEENLIADAWFWLNRLIKLLNDNPEEFPSWKDSEAHKQMEDLPVSIDDFARYVGVSDPTFLLYAGWLVREVYRECIQSRQTADASLSEVQKQAVCYDVMARACRRLAFHALPSPIRIDINNEMGKNHAAQADTTIREKVAGVFAEKAAAYWKAVDAELQTKQEQNTATYQSARRISERDKFAVS
ncbi:MAG: hypothetical protein IJQ84_08990 [Paludibacteraceae bacterium]|nr:hypothetical protein [Paludibacteraceae bacterium]MBQ6983872.1 hypothetical protein [Paludibacteraceae bacterium]